MNTGARKGGMTRIRNALINNQNQFRSRKVCDVDSIP